MVVVLDRKKEDIARWCPTCKGKRCVMSDDPDLVIATCLIMWGKKPILPLFEGPKLDKTQPGPDYLYRGDCPDCDGKGYQLYVPKANIVLEDPKA
jgi:hypothetical protein